MEIHVKDVIDALKDKSFEGWYWRHTGGGVGTLTYHYDGYGIYVGPGNYATRTLFLDADACCVGAYSHEGDELGYKYVTTVEGIVDAALDSRDAILKVLKEAQSVVKESYHA